MTTVEEMPESSVLEERIARGDRDAMAQFLAIARVQGVSEKELKRRYRIVWDADHGNDSMIFRNLSIVAAAAGEFHKTAAYARDFIQSFCYSDAYHSALALREYGADDERLLAEEILSELANRGHILSQVQLRKFASDEQGFLGKVGFQFYRFFKILQATFLVVKNSEDPRVST